MNALKPENPMILGRIWKPDCLLTAREIDQTLIFKLPRFPCIPTPGPLHIIDQVLLMGIKAANTVDPVSTYPQPLRARLRRYVTFHPCRRQSPLRQRCQGASRPSY